MEKGLSFQEIVLEQLDIPIWQLNLDTDLTSFIKLMQHG